MSSKIVNKKVGVLAIPEKEKEMKETSTIFRSSVVKTNGFWSKQIVLLLVNAFIYFLMRSIQY